MARTLLLLLTGAVVASGCGGDAETTAGHYEGTCTGSITILKMPFAVDGTVGFDLQPAGDQLQAYGQLSVKARADASKTYQATLGGTVSGGSMSLTFTATDGKSSGTMSASLAGSCWTAGVWNIAGLATAGSGTWSACRK
jgi:hypothetical protein